MRLFTVAKSTTMIFCAASASIFSCVVAVITASTIVVDASICARRAVSSSGSILRNVSLVVTI